MTLEALRRCKQELGVRTVLGVSNISFGLPQRETVNAAFLTMALAAGLDAAILNPMSEAMMRAFRASLALTGADARVQPLHRLRRRAARAGHAARAGPAA